MISVFAVVSPSRSGTTWYSRLFTHEEVFCYHELATLLQPIPSNTVLAATLKGATRDHDFEQRQRRHFLDAYPRYFSRLLERAQLGQRHVGNSDVGLLHCAAGAWLVWPETRFVFSVRNGINQVNSMFVAEPKRTRFVREMRQQRLRELPDFELSCRRWVGMIERWTMHREWLAERGARCLSTTLERVTGDVDELERVWSWVVGDWDRHADRAVSMMRRPVNERVNLDGAVRTPEEVWAAWSAGQRAAFVKICGASQESLGYEIPM